VAYEGFMPAVLAAMETPAIITAILLARLGAGGRALRLVLRPALDRAAVATQRGGGRRDAALERDRRRLERQAGPRSALAAPRRNRHAAVAFVTPI
jgi:hypothetical protein